VAPQVKMAPWAILSTLIKPKISENPEETRKRSMPMATPEMVSVMYVLGLMKRMGRRKMAITANVGSHAFCFVLIGFLFIPG
jgi:hypothetical protein